MQQLTPTPNPSPIKREGLPDRRMAPLTAAVGEGSGMGEIAVFNSQRTLLRPYMLTAVFGVGFGCRILRFVGVLYACFDALKGADGDFDHFQTRFAGR